MIDSIDLGLVKAIQVSTTEPSNQNMIWYDDNIGQKIHKYYDVLTTTWKTFSSDLIFIQDITWVNLKLLKNSNNLKPGLIYRITDRFNYQSTGSGIIPNQTFLGDDRGIIYIQALSTSTLSKEAIRLMAVPIDYKINNSLLLGGVETKGIWNSNKTANIDDYFIWGGRYFQNTTGLIGKYDNENTLNSSDYLLLNKSVSYITPIYEDKQFNVIYDFDNDWIEKQLDQNNNELGISYILNQNTYLLNFNPVDISDWNVIMTDIQFHDNKGFGIYNNTCTDIHSNKFNFIFNNSNLGQIFNNIIISNIENNSNSGSIIFNICVSISLNSNDGEINYNVVGEISTNSNSGAILKNTNKGNINNNTNGGKITLNFNDGDISNNLTPISIIEYNSNKGNISTNSNSGNISRNSNLNSIVNNSNTGNIELNSNFGKIELNSNLGNIKLNSYNYDILLLNSSILELSYNKITNTNMGAYFEYVIDVTGLSNINLGVFAKYLSDILLTSTNSSETITDILNINGSQKIRFRPDSTLTSLTFVHNAAKIRCEAASSAILDGSKSDFIEFEKPHNFNAVRQTNIGTY